MTTMLPSPARATTRRRVLQLMAATAGALTVGLRLDVPDARAGSGETFMPNAFITIGPGDAVLMTMPYVEMGQGIYTAVAMLLAEELEVDLSQVTLEHAPADAKRYGNPVFGGLQATGGSTSIRASWTPMREAGAAARMMLIAAAARRWSVPEGECRAAAGKVFHDGSGRQASFGELAASAASLPLPDPVKLKEPRDFRLIGKPAKRLDTPSKVNGTARFGIDARPPGVKIATLAQSPAFGGRLKSVDDRAALAVKGVRQVVRLDDAVAVVADHMGAAKKGLAALSITWDDGPNAALTTKAIVDDLEQATRSPGAIAQQSGHVDDAFTSAARVVEASYLVPFLAHAALEPMNCTVHVRPDSCEVWVGTQVIGRAQQVAAEVTGLPADKVTVHNHLIGGGFGRRLEVDGVKRAVEIARHVEGPVKVVWTREEDIQHDMYRPMFFDRMRAALDAQGRPVAWSHRFAGSSVLSRWLPPAFQNGLDPDTTDGAVDLVYAIPNLQVEYVRREPAGVPTAFWRSVGPSHNVFAVETFIDELAAAARKDPVAYRLSLMTSSPRAAAVLDLAAAKAGWTTPLQGRAGRGVSVQNVFGSHLAVVAEIAVADTGAIRVKRLVCAVDCGQVVNPDTVRAQIEGAVLFGLTAALYGEITIQGGRVEQSNFDSYQPLRIDEAPSIEVHIVNSGEAPGGMGEPGTSVVGPAIGNAIFAATGKRLRKMPFEAALLKA